MLEGTSYAPGVNNVLVNDSVSIQLVCSNLAIGDTARILRSMTINPNVGLNGMPQFRTTPTGGTIVDAQIGYDITSYKVTISYSANTIGFGGDVVVNDYVPKKIKQADFIKSIFTMYNLFVDIDKTNTNNLILKTRDEYYDQGAQRDWTEKLAKDRDQNLQFLPELVNKRMVLTYKQDADERCKIEQYELLFMDRMGSFSSFAFQLRAYEKGTTKRETYNKHIVGSTAVGDWTYDSYDRGQKVINPSVERTLDLNTNWMTENMSVYFEELITSPEVYLKDTDGLYYAVLIQDTSFEINRYRNKNLFKKNVTIKYANENIING